MIISPNPVIELKNENGKKVTVGTYGVDVTMVFWRKNDSVLLPLVMNRMEAARLRSALDKAISEASAAQTGTPATQENLARDIQAAVIKRRA